VHFLTLGSVSPDIPYLAHLAGSGFGWADIMHYHQTNGIVTDGLHSLAAAKERGGIWESQLAWLCGFISHLVADATIHPIVESIVGPYSNKDNRGNHQQCEMFQDVIMFKEVKNLQLTNSEYADFLHDAIDSDKFSDVAAFWKTYAEVNCSMYGSFNVERIIESYTNMLDTASGGNIFARMFRHLGKDIIYPSYNEIIENSPDLVDKYYRNVLLPNGRTGSFLKEGFNRAVDNLVNIWKDVERILFNSGNFQSIVPNWNLDTGIDQTTGIRTYWS
jgi:hypothetical protein